MLQKPLKFVTAFITVYYAYYGICITVITDISGQKLQKNFSGLPVPGNSKIGLTPIPHPKPIQIC